MQIISRISTPKHLLILFFIVPLAFSCDESNPASASYEGTTKSGVKYKILSRGGKGARKVKVGDLLSFHLIIKNHKDSIIRNTYKDFNGMIKQVPFQEMYIPKPMREVFAFMAEGDSVNIWIKADSLITKGQEMPPFLKKGTDLLHTVKLIKVQTQEEIKRENAELEAKNKKKNEEELQKYIKEKGLKAERTQSGLYYVIEKQGTGKQPKPGDKVKVHYTGYTLQGNKFDSSVDRGQPFELLIGRGMVIQGWDEGIPLFKEGGKGKLLIPSHLAYGGQGAGGVIQPYQCLVFDIELVKVEEVPKADKVDKKSNNSPIQ
ncbi:MAG: FKBP-type peptidyl-prolyl cis-trans isomerase [Microscillaceae bacterium]|nr:FKBP-type peptidyl-prolyl cis-trans isomerase [Microscillaceae bacterium]MDW8460968.1 FKBP-type peptidyl-prolyl cis-trans isomerase [Cytophagales bacterium]